MSVVNHTPFPALAFRQYNLAGNLNGVVVVQGTFYLSRGGPLLPAREQVPLRTQDEYEGDPHGTSCVGQTALVPFKPGTDVTFIGDTYAPGSIALPCWDCALTAGPVSKTLRVHGPRWWEPVVETQTTGLIFKKTIETLAGWRLSEAEPARSVALDWTLAAGDAWNKASANPLDAPLNPIGRMPPPTAPESRGDRIAAPRIESPARPLRDWRQAPPPESFGHVPPWWRQRLPLAGTFDQTWLEIRHPLLPADFDYRFWQSAHPDLIVPGWLGGGEPFELVNLLPDAERLRGRLPGIGLSMRLPRGDGFGTADLNLDGVYFDMRPGAGHVVLTWRAGFPWPDGKGEPEIAPRSPIGELV